MFSGDESGSYGDFDGDFGDSPLSGAEIEVEPQESAQNSDKQWLSKFLSESLKKLSTAVETELTDIKNKKKSRNSKNKDKINTLLKKLEGWKKVRERAEELTISMDYLEGGSLKELRIRVRKFLISPEEDEVRIPVVEEIEVLIELSEQNRRK